MRLTILIIIVVLVGISFTTTIIQNFLPGGNNATSTGSGFSFVSIYTPYRGDKNAIYKESVPSTQTPAKTTTPTPTPTKEIEISVDPNQSIFKGKIKISGVSGSSESANDESLSISNNTNTESIDITGFAIENSSGEKFLIPRGYNLPGYGVTPKDEIVLSAGGRASIRVGRQERQMNFRENLCTGYFDQSSNFNNALSRNCPKPDLSKNTNLTYVCINTLNSIPSCRTMNNTTQIDYTCNQFANEHYNYVGCVNDFRSKENFYTKNWLIWMQRTGEFFGNLHEKVILRDRVGKIVDEYSY